WGVRLFDRGGRPLWRTSVPGAAWLVNLTPDGRFVVAGLGDGSIRWYRTGDGSEALALFAHPDGRWLLWTPEGFHAASPATATAAGGASLLGYHLNQGRDREAAFVSAAQLPDFYRPQLIAARLRGDEAAISAAVARLGDVRQVLRASALPPRLRLLSQRALPTGDIEIRYQLIDEGGGIGPLKLRLREAGDPGEGREISGRADPPVAGITRLVLPAPPPRRKSKLRLIASSRGGVSSLPVELDLQGADSAAPPTLHLLAVGITAYRDGSLRNGVKFAAADARAFRQALLAAGRPPTSRVAEPVLLTDEEASRDRIRQELRAIGQRVRPGDLFVLYLAGHGVSDDNGEYLFLPQDVLYRNNASLREGGLGEQELRQLLAGINTNKTVVVLDTCSSGAFSFGGRSLGEKGAIDRLARLSGRVVLAAAGDQRMALESADGQRGIFTGSLLRALAGQADSDRNGEVGVLETAAFVEGEVKRITRERFGYEQTPMYELNGQNFPLSRSGGR
ncbi:MAG: caspase family protein, partial [Synechococcaceae cyanobacterium]|nr:caspase family protein [Synechococcaceae cyanobacterium]